MVLLTRSSHVAFFLRFMIILLYSLFRKIKNKISYMNLLKSISSPFKYLYCIQIISYYNAEYFRMKLHSSFFYDFEILFPSNWPSGRNIYQFGEVMTISCDGQKSLEDKKIFVSFFGWNNKRCERVEELNTKKGVVVIVSVNEWGISMVLLYHIYFREKII